MLQTGSICRSEPPGSSLPPLCSSYGSIYSVLNREEENRWVAMMRPSRFPHPTEETSARLGLVHEDMSCGSYPSLLEGRAGTGDLSGSSVLNEREWGIYG